MRAARAGDAMDPADASFAGAWNRLTASNVSSMAKVTYPAQGGLITQFRLLSPVLLKKIIETHWMNEILG